jgi:predicted nucleic acid-binding protein
MTNKVMEFMTQEFHLAQEFGDVYRNRYIESCEFVDKALELPSNNQQFLVTELSLTEAFSGIREEVRSIIMFTQGIPISRWAYKRETKEVSFPQELSRKLYELTSKGFDALFERKIEIMPVTTPSDTADYFDFYSSLVFLYPMLRTQDAILITTAIFQKATHFVTMDKDLIVLGKELKKVHPLEVLKPREALKLFK